MLKRGDDVQQQKPSEKGPVKYLWGGDGITRIYSEKGEDSGKEFGKPMVDKLEIKQEMGKQPSPNTTTE